MRALLIVLAGACASVGTSVAVWAVIAMEPTDYCEVATGGLIRTNLPESVINLSVSEVLEATRPLTERPDRSMVESEYSEQTRAWFSVKRPLRASTERACRLIREQNDLAGGRTRIETLHGEDMPSLVFVEHRDEVRRATIAQMLAARLQSYGATIQ